MASSSGKMMNAVRFHGKEDLRFEQVPEPECGKGQIKIKPAWCGICGRVRVVHQPGTRRERGECRARDKED
jgi:threonine dehydrogenase-like Zn-dependent dehydrogenase